MGDSSDNYSCSQLLLTGLLQGTLHESSQNTIWKLLLAQNAVRWVVVGTSRCTHVSSLLCKLYWLPYGYRNKITIGYHLKRPTRYTIWLLKRLISVNFCPTNETKQNGHDVGLLGHMSGPSTFSTVWCLPTGVIWLPTCRCPRSS